MCVPDVGSLCVRCVTLRDLFVNLAGVRQQVVPAGGFIGEWEGGGAFESVGGGAVELNVEDVEEFCHQLGCDVGVTSEQLEKMLQQPLPYPDGTYLPGNNW